MFLRPFFTPSAPIRARALAPITITRKQMNFKNAMPRCYADEFEYCLADKCSADEVVWSLGEVQAGSSCMQRDRDATTGAVIGMSEIVNRAKANTIKCSTVDPQTECPVFGDQVARVTGDRSLQGLLGASHKYTCNYDANKVASTCKATSDYTKYVRERDKDPFKFDDAFMRIMCAQQADPATCPDKESKYVDKTTGKPICGNMVACPLCQEWAASSISTTTGKALADQAMKEWCSAHSVPSSAEDQTVSDPACLCINRDYTEMIKQMQGFKGADPLCWYRPCVDRQLKRYLVPSDQRTPTCPDKLCTQIIDFAGNQGISIEDMNQYMNCGTVDPNPKPGPQPKPKPYPDTTVDWWGKLSSAEKATLIGGSSAAMLLVIFGVAGIMFMKTSEKNTK